MVHSKQRFLDVILNLNSKQLQQKWLHVQTITQLGKREMRLPTLFPAFKNLHEIFKLFKFLSKLKKFSFQLFGKKNWLSKLNLVPIFWIGNPNRRTDPRTNNGHNAATDSTPGQKKEPTGGTRLTLCLSGLCNWQLHNDPLNSTECPGSTYHMSRKYCMSRK